MGLVKSKGNMYDWVTHMHTHLRGRCPHGCRYCYVQAMSKRFPNMAKQYGGELRLDESELLVNYGSNKIIFIEHQNDMGCQSVPLEWIEAIGGHCRKYPDNEYVFQSKNPAALRRMLYCFPDRSLFGTTVESDLIPHDVYDIGCLPPPPKNRLEAMLGWNVRKFITVEPVMRMHDPVGFARMIADCKPEFVNIGADSKGIGLDEPSKEQLGGFIEALHVYGVTIKHKTNLGRLLA